MKKRLVVVFLLVLTSCIGNRMSEEEINKIYNEMEGTMAGYYDDFYQKMVPNMADGIKDKTLKVPLSQLRDNNYDTSIFVDPITKVICDEEKSYAYIIQSPDEEKYPEKEYVIEVYMVCGDYINKVDSPVVIIGE